MRIFLFLLLTTQLTLVDAQESASTSEENEIQEQKPADDASTKKKTEVETPDSFDATEKLSEDIPAPFPVDI